MRASDGVVLDPAGFAITTAASSQVSPVIAFGGGEYLVAWDDSRSGSGSDVDGARVRASDGAVLDSGGLALCTDASYQAPPALAFDGSTYLMVWRDSRSGVARLNGSRVKPDGTVLDGTGFLIANMTGSGASTSVPAVSSWGQGRFLVAYEPYDTAAGQLRVKVRLVSDPVNGARCESGPECTSGFCVDGVCCDSACVGGTCGGGSCVLPSPQITCPGNVVAEATSGAGAVVSYPPATVTGTAPLTVTYSQSSGTQFALGSTSVTATVTDGLGRTNSCAFTVTVQDTTAPALSCPAHLTEEATSAEGAIVTYPPATASDTTSSPTLHYNQTSGTRFPLGTTQVTVTATDGAGTSASCTFDVTVQDTTAPMLSCPADVWVKNAPAQGMAVEYPAATSSDAVSTPVLSYSQASGTLFPVGTTQVTATATDAAGNSATCSFKVRVDASVSTPAPSEGCGCGAGSGTPAGLGWAALLLLAWRGARRRLT